MAFSDVKKFVARWRKELVVLVGGVPAVLFVLWLFGQITFVKQEVTLVQIITAILVLVGLYWTSRRVLAAEETVRVGQDNVRVAEEGQITERFTKAIAQLGADKMAIRLGGIYALERIAKDSEKDHGPIMAVLTAYVREKATKEGEYAEEAAHWPTTDIQAILTVIGRRKTTDIKKFEDRLDLSTTHLAGVVIPDANLVGVILIRANLSDAILIRANLSDANLIDANLVGANLSDANLVGANLSDANLVGAEDLTAEQVRSAKNWRDAHLPEDLQYLKDLPD